MKKISILIFGIAFILLLNVSSVLASSNPSLLVDNKAFGSNGSVKIGLNILGSINNKNVDNWVLSYSCLKKVVVTNSNGKTICDGTKTTKQAQKISAKTFNPTKNYQILSINAQNNNITSKNINLTLTAFSSKGKPLGTDNKTITLNPYKEKKIKEVGISTTDKSQSEDEGEDIELTIKGKGNIHLPFIVYSYPRAGDFTCTGPDIVCLEEDISSGFSLELNPVPHENYEFVGWTGSDASAVYEVGGRYFINMDKGTASAKTQLTANFQLKIFNLFVGVKEWSGGRIESDKKEGTLLPESGYILCGGFSYDHKDCITPLFHGAVTTLRAIEDKENGWYFTGWSSPKIEDCGGCDFMIDKDNEYIATYKMGETDAQIMAYFKKKSNSLDTALLGTGSGDIEVDPYSETYEEGEVVTITANVSSDSELNNWIGCDSVSGNVCTVTMNSDKSVGADVSKVTAMDVGYYNSMEIAPGINYALTYSGNTSEMMFKINGENVLQSYITGTDLVLLATDSEWSCNNSGTTCSGPNKEEILFENFNSNTLTTKVKYNPNIEMWGPWVTAKQSATVYIGDIVQFTSTKGDPSFSYSCGNGGSLVINPSNSNGVSHGTFYCRYNTSGSKIVSISKNKAILASKKIVVLPTAVSSTQASNLGAFAGSQSSINTINLEFGMTHPNVITLQKFLNSKGYLVESTQGQSGSKGYESDYFGEKTKRALIRYQKDKNINPTQGYFGPKTRAVMGF